jgi:hypothetical protein
MNSKLAIYKSCLVLILLFSIASCKKKVTGCTDPTADTFKAEANEDDGSCSFHGFLTPWYDNTTRDSLLANNIACVSVFVDNEVNFNFIPAFILWSSEPNCSTSTIGNWVIMHGTKNKSISVTVKAFDGSNTVIRQWNETLIIESGVCKLFKIIW